MIESSNEVGIRVSENNAVLVGDPDLISTLLSRLDVDAEQVQKAGRGTVDLVAQATGIGAVVSALDGSWVQLTPESRQRLIELANFNVSPGGTFSGAFRGAKGQIDSFAQFTTGGMNPLVMSNLATLTATMALQSAVAQLEDLARAMDVKLDRLLEDNRAKALGDIQGLTQVLLRAFELYKETGKITDTAWSQVAGHATALAQASSHALAQIETLTQSLKARSFADKVNAAETLADNELRSWLVILAACQANQQRLETLELVHLRQHDPEAVEAHAASIQVSATKRNDAAANRLQSLVDALTSAANVSDFNRLRSPQKSRSLLDSAESASRLIGTFAEIYGLDGLGQGEVERETWRKSLSDLAKTTTTAVSSVAKAVPVGIAKVSGDAVIRAASQIEAQRSTTKDMTAPTSAEPADPKAVDVR
ncbi:hypothetical protein [Arthrobacter sp. AL12]|uniref:hypothetical protein n=1 Tax=Arthrobacter sp. AL12 TaxID=3042241 RepID=UPI00249B8999|nr:hypothetical protein [Arthrobacter sp. AL12]MDI3213230.1 hypothetical protein [Arthrobacter sp. AL12]